MWVMLMFLLFSSMPNRVSSCPYLLIVSEKRMLAGFKCYKREVIELIQLDKINFVGYAFQIEMKFKAWLHGFNIVEVPVIFTDRTEGESKMNTDIFFEAFVGVIQLKVKSWFTKFEQAKK